MPGMGGCLVPVGACSGGLRGPVGCLLRGCLVPGGPPGPHPSRKLKGIRYRPTPKGEIEGDQVQAHTQGGN